MSKTELIPRLKVGRVIIAKLVEDENEKIILEKQDGSRIALPFTKEFISALSICEDSHPILEIRMEEDGYHIFELANWPDEKTEEKDDD
ncbi:MAG: hypothetical protein M0R40_09810 [Firmicutes bacterium]|nr:hypothetical protein [Bacillota bacterium]